MDLCWVWGQKSKRHILSLNFVPFPNGGPISFWHTMMIWWGQDVKCKGIVMCIFHVWTIDCFRIVTPLPFDIQLWCFTHVYPLSQGGSLYILGQAVMVNLESLNLLPGGVLLKPVNFKWMWVGSRVNDIYVYTLPALVYSLHHDQTVLKRTLSVKVPTYKEWLDK